MKTFAIILIIFASISFFIPLVGGTVLPLLIALLACVAVLSKTSRGLVFIALALNTLNIFISPTGWQDFGTGAGYGYAQISLSVEAFAVLIAIVASLFNKTKAKSENAE